MEKIKKEVDIFKQDLNYFRTNQTYPTQAINLVERHQEQLVPILGNWNNALTRIKLAFNLDNSSLETLPTKLHQITFEKVKNDLEKSSKNRIVIGIAGPGACGKGSLVESLNLPKVLNTTTRPPRSYEIDNLHYHFVNDSIFHKMEACHEFLSVTPRPGRGFYGVEKKSLENTFSQSKMAIIEENPDTLFKIQQSLEKDRKSTYFSINYILPPQPIILHLATRLAKRSIETNGNFLDSIDNTLGQRQIDEFESLIDINKNGGNICFFVVDNNIDQIASIIKNTYKIS
ncbi:MAG: hypothetical protein PHH12_01775 [Candidatus Shapirobacteria bacterium]|nr:hypothetical protein [Candidatus Shapirobacteria bacterium]